MQRVQKGLKAHTFAYLLILGLALWMSFTSAQGDIPEPLMPDTVTTEVLGEASPHWVWVVDVNFLGLTASKALLVDADSLKVLGSVSSGLTPNLEVSPDGSEFYVVETYYSKGTRGERQDLVAVYDGKTLSLKTEIEIPAHFSVVSKRLTAAISSDGRFLAVFNMRPATSVSIVDLNNHSLVGEFETPCCYMLTPSMQGVL
ncbi:MAG: amine dehydrogenase large subunit [Deinococcales bacterium]